MPTFEYRGRDATGRLLTGTRLAQSEDALGMQLMKEGITPIAILLAKEKSYFWAQLNHKLFYRHVSLEELSLFSRQMNLLCKTGVPISSALKQLAENTRHVSMRLALQGIVEHLEAGQDLASAMQMYPSIFSPMMVNMIRVGQNSGRLDDAFLRLNYYLELETDSIRNIKTALRYPAIVFSTLIAAIIVINIFVIPSFTTIFKQANIPLPLATILLVHFSDALIHYWFLWIVGIVGFISGIYFYLRTPQGKLRWHEYELKIPVVGGLIRRIMLLRFAQSFALIITSGVSLIEGLDLVAHSVSNTFIRHSILAMKDAIQRGKTLTQAAVETRLFNAIELQMFSVSEATGDLANTLEQIAKYHQREVEYELKRLNDVIEPILIILLSAVVLVLAFAVYLPIWNMVKFAHT